MRVSPEAESPLLLAGAYAARPACCLIEEPASPHDILATTAPDRSLDSIFLRFSLAVSSSAIADHTFPCFYSAARAVTVYK